MNRNLHLDVLASVRLHLVAGSDRCSRARLVEIDVAKGLAILLVVFGHIVARETPAGVEWYEPLRGTIYLFHMPFFMYLSGFATFYSGAARTPVAAWPSLIRRRAGRLLVPFFGLGLLVLVGKLLAARAVAVDNVPAGLGPGLLGLLWNTAESPAGSVWYVFVLFIYAAATPLLIRMTKGHAMDLIAPALLLYAVPIPAIVYLDRVGANFVFFLAGGLAAEAGGVWQSWIDRWRWRLLLSFGALLAALWAIGGVPAIGPGGAKWAHKAAMLAAGLLSAPALHALARTELVRRSRVLLALGTLSFAIYLLNTICIGIAKAALSEFLLWNEANFHPFAGALMVAGVLGPMILKTLVFRRFRFIDRITS
ncbi:MAG: acyltransferase [Acetobacteraceae bacterium]|nr:acyltransferase [Acetobacteraceae bacterium]